ncbi:hypothetical protein A4R44_02752 [Amycolatopsis sp. M39]|nr:hypothetical protein A4R44_02752 [Amycolatopsis sp. M39]
MRSASRRNAGSRSGVGVEETAARRARPDRRCRVTGVKAEVCSLGEMRETAARRARWAGRGGECGRISGSRKLRTGGMRKAAGSRARWAGRGEQTASAVPNSGRRPRRADGAHRSAVPATRRTSPRHPSGNGYSAAREGSPKWNAPGCSDSSTPATATIATAAPCNTSSRAAWPGFSCRECGCASARVLRRGALLRPTSHRGGLPVLVLGAIAVFLCGRGLIGVAALDRRIERDLHDGVRQRLLAPGALLGRAGPRTKNRRKRCASCEG